MLRSNENGYIDKVYMNCNYGSFYNLCFDGFDTDVDKKICLFQKMVFHPTLLLIHMLLNMHS